MPGRDVSLAQAPAQPRARSRGVGVAVAALALVGLGIAIGSRIATPRETPAAITTSPTTTTSSPAARQPRPTRPSSAGAHTRTGAVEASARAITAFDGDVLLDPVKLRATVDRIASTGSRATLLRVFQQASAQTRAKLGADTVPKPVILLRSVPIGYRIDSYSPDEAKVAVWYVGVVGSGASIDPQQSWITQYVTIVWERGAWRVSTFESTPGPTPPLSTPDATGTPADLFATIPRFQEFGDGTP